jgi:hypothetical protein
MTLNRRERQGVVYTTWGAVVEIGLRMGRPVCHAGKLANTVSLSQFHTRNGRDA